MGGLAPVAGVHRADKDPGLAVAAKIVRGIARVLQGLVSALQKQPFLGVHGFRFTRRNTEKQRIEAVHVIKKAAPTGIHFPRFAFLGVKVCLPFPAAGGTFTHAIVSCFQLLPECIDIRGFWIAPAEADDRHVKDVQALLPGSAVAVDGWSALPAGLQVSAEVGLPAFPARRRFGGPQYC